ncbi:MAG: glycosyltransferase family 39 protein, partial [Chloroflexota bacterium]
KDFVVALSAGDLAATLVGDGYPGIVPIWAETIWIFLEAGRRSWVEGQWIGEPGLYHLFHEWDRTAFLAQQRLPIVFVNIVIALSIVWAVRHLFGTRVALLSGLLIALDPFYLSDSRVNRAEAMITGLMTLSILFLIFYYQRRQFRYVFASGVFGGLGMLTKIQALSIAPAIALTAGLIYFLVDQVWKTNSSASDGSNTKQNDHTAPLSRRRIFTLTPASTWLFIRFGLGWIAAALLTWLILWPAMWVTPFETLELVYNYTTRKVGTEGVNLFFLGQTYFNADPGPLFYPIVFLLRITPLTFLGLIGMMLAGLRSWPLSSQSKVNGWLRALPNNPFVNTGVAILLIYILTYALAMTIGSHKQDRYLMPVFLTLDILAAMGLSYLWLWLQPKIGGRQTTEWLLFSLLVIIQVATIFPHHPYYYSYFNPLFGGGKTAVRTLRVGWGEGMDQVGRYLAAKPDSENLIVSTRFTHNLVDFRGQTFSLVDDGRWTQADYIVLYIQQVQRYTDPSPGFIDYFQARSAEKVVVLGDIEYAWIYPRPFSVFADPKTSYIPDKLALLGYSWEAMASTNETSTLRLFWDNQGIAESDQLVVRLMNATTEAPWQSCVPDPNFVTQSATVGQFVESLCDIETASLVSGIYTVEFGLISKPVDTDIQIIPFSEGWHAAQMNGDKEMSDTTQLQRFNAIVEASIPPEAEQLDRIYDGLLRLAAYRVTPATPQPGETVTVTLYWQPIKEIVDTLNLTVQLADSRNIALGRHDNQLYDPDDTGWVRAEIATTHHEFPLPADLESLLAAQIEVTIVDQAEVFLPITDQTGRNLDQIAGRFTIRSDVSSDIPELVGSVEAEWEKGISLQGYQQSPATIQAGEALGITLYWQTDQPIGENYVVFLHLIDETGQLVAQNDSLPRAGTYPTQWWPPEASIEDRHTLVLPEILPTGQYQLMMGLYNQADGVRLPLQQGGNDILKLTDLTVP